MFFKKQFDEYGYALDEIIWGNIVIGDTFYDSCWEFFISFIEKDTKKIICLDLTRYLDEQERKHPRKLKKELLESMKGQNIITCLQILVEKFPKSANYIYKKIPSTLIEKAGLDETFLNPNTNTI